MPIKPSNDDAIHVNHTFTELFHLLKQSNLLDTDINMILQHSDNAITGILHGLQAIGSLLATSTLVEKDDVVHLGYFLTLIANLMEALNILRSDCEFHLNVNEEQMVTIQTCLG